MSSSLPDASRSNEEIRISNRKYTEGREIERTSKIFMRSFIPDSGALSVLDIGCGTGLNAEAIAAKGHHVSGVDISDIAIKKFNDAGFEGRVGDITAGLPYAEGSFDIVFASEIIEHVSDTAVFLAEARRVLKPGGTLLLSTPNSACWIFRVYALLGKTLTEVQHPGHVRFFSLKSLKKAIEDAGFRVTQAASRNMYMVIPFDAPWAGLFGFTRERRFKTQTYFWHLSRNARNASNFWADTLIINAIKE